MKRMVYIIIAVTTLIVIGSVAVGCSTGSANQNKADIEGVSLSQSHMNFNECYSFYLREENGKVLFDAEVRFEEEPYEIILESCEVDASYMSKLEEIDNTYKISSYVDKYKKKTPPFQVLDETKNTTAVYFKDGTDKSADTSSTYEQELYNFFEDIALKYKNLSANVVQ